MANLNIVSIDPNQAYYKIQIDYETVIGQYYKTMGGFVLTYLPSGPASSGPSSSRFSLVFTSKQDAQNFLLECEKQNVRMSSGNPKTASLSPLSANLHAYHHYYPWSLNNTPVTSVYKSKAKYIFGDKLVNIKDFFVEKQKHSSNKTSIRKLSFNTNVYVPLDACVELLGIYAGDDYDDSPFEELTNYIQDNFLNDIIKLDATGVNAEVDLDKLRDAPKTILATINEELIDAENITCVGKACINNLFTPALNGILWDLEKLKSLTIKSLNTSEENTYLYISSFDFTPEYQCPNLETINIVTPESSHIEAIRYDDAAIFNPALCPKVACVNITDAFKYRLRSYKPYNRNTALKELKELGLEKLSGNLQNFECVDIDTLYNIMFKVLTTKYKDLFENGVVRTTTNRTYDTILLKFDKPLDKFIANLITNVALDTIGPEEDTIVYSTTYIPTTYLPSLDALCYIGYNSTYKMDELDIYVEPIFYKKGTEFAEDMAIKLHLFELVMDNIFSVLQSQEFFDDDSNFIIDESNFTLDEKLQMKNNLVEADNLWNARVWYNVCVDRDYKDQINLDDQFRFLDSAMEYCSDVVLNHKKLNWYFMHDDMNFGAMRYYCNYSDWSFTIYVNFDDDVSIDEIYTEIDRAWLWFKKYNPERNNPSDEQIFIENLKELCLDYHQGENNWEYAYNLFIRTINSDWHDEDFILDESKKSKELKEEMSTYTEINSIDTVSDRAKNRMLMIPIKDDPKYTLTLGDANKAWTEFKTKYNLKTPAVIADIEWKSYISYYDIKSAANIYLGFFDKPIPEKVFRKSQEEFLQTSGRAVWYDIESTRNGSRIKSSFNPTMTYNCVYIAVTGTEQQTITTYVDSDFILDEE